MCVGWEGRNGKLQWQKEEQGGGEREVGDGKAAWQLLRQTEGHELLSAYLLQGKKGQWGAGKARGRGEES